MVEDYKDLLVWQKSFCLCKLVFKLTTAFPVQDKYGLVHQLRKSAVSVPSNIAEGNGRGTRKDYVRFLWIARGSACELETQLLLARDIGLASRDESSECIALADECKRMLLGLIRSLERTEA